MAAQMPPAMSAERGTGEEDTVEKDESGGTLVQTTPPWRKNRPAHRKQPLQQPSMKKYERKVTIVFSWNPCQSCYMTRYSIGGCHTVDSYVAKL